MFIYIFDTGYWKTKKKISRDIVHIFHVLDLIVEVCQKLGPTLKSSRCYFRNILCAGQSNQRIVIGHQKKNSTGQVAVKLRHSVLYGQSFPVADCSVVFIFLGNS